MQQATLVNNVRNNAARILSLIEQAQAIAASQAQEYNKLGGATFLEGFTWDGDVTEQNLLDAVSSLTSAFPDILGAHGTNLYRLKG
jgi:hypothetical protein